MNTDKYFNAGESHGFVPTADTKRQAVHALKGYAYQCVAAALEWVDISETGRLYLEVAEDYAILAKGVLRATQVKDTKKSAVVTLNSTGVRQAINAFVELVEKNPGIDIDLHYLTTSEVGNERDHTDRPAGMAGLNYWNEVAAGAEVEPLREILESGKFDNAVSRYCQARDDTDLRDSLIKKLHWHCGSPDFATLRKELESRLVVIGRNLFQISSEEARRLVDHLIYRVLETSIINESERRFLTRADFYELVDSKTRISVPRAFLDSLFQRFPELADSIGEKSKVSITGSATHTDFFIKGDTLPILRQMIPRADLETSVNYALSKFGICILVGGSGVGKSVMARQIATHISSQFLIVDYRDMQAVETRIRLNSVFSRVGELSAPTLILEDLNYLDDPQVISAFGQVIESVLRRGRKLLVTCYQEPSLSTLSAIGLHETCVVLCPYFKEEEARVLVEACGGDPEIWGKIAYFTGRSGHPQLTHAFVVGMSGRGWPMEEYEDVISSGLSSEDTEAVRSAVRPYLTRNLSVAARNLLYRLSLVIGQFKKSLALSIASISPDVPQAGECIDQLVGPWIEARGENRYRISPLVSGIGSEMLAMEVRKCIHKTIAEEFLQQNVIDAFDINTVTFHALAAEWETGLVLIAQVVLSTDSSSRGALAEHAMLIRFFRINSPIYPNNQAVSIYLRLAQFTLAVVAEEQGQVSGIVTALFNEVDALPPGELKNYLETLAVLKVNSTLGIANQVDNWVHILTRSIRIAEHNENFRGLVAGTEGVTADDNSIFFGQLFAVGSSNLMSVERLEIIVEQLDQINKHTRNLFLTPIDKGSSDYSVFVNMPWVTEQHSEKFDAVDAAVRYARIAEKTLSWNISSLTAQCWAAQSIILNEFLNEKEKSLAVLEEAFELLGHNLILSRAQASVHWHQGEHEIALECYRSIVEHIGQDNPVERTFALREAAISAAKCDLWLLAEKWFLEGQQAAVCLDSNEMIVMAIGLRADAAAAALRAGNPERALAEFAEIIDSLKSLGTDDTIAAAYCHRVVRHAILWVKSYIEGTFVKVGGQPIELEPGACSNPNPRPEIRKLPLGHIDCAWYLLAEAEVSANVDVGIISSLNKQLVEGKIPMLELSLRSKIIERDINNIDIPSFIEHLTKYIETTVFCSKKSEHLKSTFDVATPIRENIPTLDSYSSVDPTVEHAAREAVLGFAIRAVLAGQTKFIQDLENALIGSFGDLFPGKSIYDYWNNRQLSLPERDKVVAEIILRHSQHDYISPREMTFTGLRFFGWVDLSKFRDSLILQLANWLRSSWARVLKQEKFQLLNPATSAPPISRCLENSRNDASFIAELLLATTEATDLQLTPQFRDEIKQHISAN